MMEKMIVISGMAGKVPNANNLGECKHQIYNKIDMITNCKRFKRRPDAPERYGAIPTIDKFDHAFFGIQSKQADLVSAVNRICLEVVCEALWDAGISLEDIKGTKVSISIGRCFDESQMLVNAKQLMGGTSLYVGAMIGSFLEVDGPHHITDAACSSSLYAFEHAFLDLKHGKADLAIVLGNNLILSAHVTAQFMNYGMLSKDGACKSFDRDANGYVRADSIQAVILQRSCDAKRQYAEVVNIRTSSDGFKTEGILAPVAETQVQLFTDFYAANKIPLNEIGYIEAHGTGTTAGDPAELNAIERHFCKSRNSPLLFGSIKSNLGHAEGASGLNSIIKCCWAFQENKIAPNINFKNPNPKVPGMLNGKLTLVREITDLPGKPYIAINNFGFGGANAHVLLRKSLNQCLERRIDEMIVCFSGRTKEAVMNLYEGLKAQPYNTDTIALINSAFGPSTAMLDCRGYCVANKSGFGEIDTALLRDGPLPLTCVLCKNVASNFTDSLLKFKCFREHLIQCRKICQDNKIDYDTSNISNNSKEDEVVRALSTIVTQTGIIELLKLINLKIVSYIGSGIGVLSAAYAHKVLSLEQTILSCYKLMQLRLTKSDTDIHKEIEHFSKLGKAPAIWKTMLNELIREEQAQDLSENMYSSKLNNNRSNVLTIGDHIAHFNNVIRLCDSVSSYDFSNAIGKLYLLGYDTRVNHLYPIKFPVNITTPMIGPLVKWDHKKSWTFIHENVHTGPNSFEISFWKSTDGTSVQGHNIDGRVLFPATGYLRLVWHCFQPFGTNPLKFENISYIRACTVTPEQCLLLTVQIQEATGYFEIIENKSVVVTGNIYMLKNFEEEWIYLPPMPVAKSEEMMNKRDVYKELGLRGYYYSGSFKEIQSCDISATVANVKWTEWSPFLDNMLQVKLLEFDTRALFVPIKIRQVVIHPEKHLDIIYTADSEECVMPVYNYKHLNIIRSGYVEIRGFEVASIAKQKHPSPILEVYKFVPYVGNLDLQNAIRVMVQIVLENLNVVNLKAIEYLNNVPETVEPMTMSFQKAMNEQPLIQAELAIYTKRNVELPMVTILKDMPTKDKVYNIVIGHNLSQNEKLGNDLVSLLKEHGYLISREDQYNPKKFNDLRIICHYKIRYGHIIMMQCPTKIVIPKPIHISADNFNWVETLKQAKRQKEHILIYSINESNNGLLGLTNCLFRESTGEKVTNVLIADTKAPEFDLKNAFYEMQLQKKLSINILKQGVWGSYRYLPIDTNATIETNHSLAMNNIRGDLSSLTWVQGKLSVPESLTIWDEEIVHVYSAAINFKDVMLVSGRIQPDSIFTGRLQQDNCIGLDCAGRTSRGERVAAFWGSGMISTLVRVPKEFIFSFPDSWTMADAATIPCIYLTNIHGLIDRANIREGDSILIHSATGGIGLSAINIALHYKCRIFLTVGTKDKREYILNHYPQINIEDIGCSRDTSFYQMIMQLTNGRGVDIILNSLADEKLQASVKCLAMNGKFIEIGKFDFIQDSSLSLELAEKNAEYHGVMLDHLASSPPQMITLLRKLREGIAEGYVQPIPYVTFEKDKLEDAFRSMTKGTHIGKVVIAIQNEESNKVVIPHIMKSKARPRIYCSPTGSYIILGGLGGFGLELADLLVLRGARNLILVSRRGLTSGYQQQRIKLWRSYECNVLIWTDDCTSLDGCSALLKQAHRMGDVKGIFNLAAVLKDAVFENQTEETFHESYIPKAQATIYLDQLSRSMCPKLEQFVVFSSISCGRGNAGQTNYGYSNSAMERICETRKQDGLPGKAIQWGLIGDVGMVAEFKEQNVEIVIGGISQQRIGNCLEVLDILLTCDDAIVSSMVVSEKHGDMSNGDAISVVSKLLQIKDIKTISPNSTFPELGMDSLMGIEIKQTLERDFNIFVSAQELKTLNFAKLANLVGEDSSNEVMPDNAVTMKTLMQFIPDETKCNISIVNMKVAQSPVHLYLIPGIEGMSTIFEPLVDQIDLNVKCLQFPLNDTPSSMTELVQQKYHILKNELATRNKFVIAVHSFSSTIALECLSLLEREGHIGTLLLLDSSPLINKAILNEWINTTSVENMQISLIQNIMSPFLSASKQEEIVEMLRKSESFKDKCQVAIDSAENTPDRSEQFLHLMLYSIFNRIYAEIMHEFKPRIYKSNIILCKPTQSIIADLSEDYDLQKLLGKKLEVHEFNGQHSNFFNEEAFIRYLGKVIMQNNI